MEKEDIHILRLMGEIERNGSFSQRELARRLNLSLGLVNRFIKRLVNKGYFKVKTLPKNRVKYLLTPKGLAQKSKLTVDYLRYSVNFYKEIKALLVRRFKEMERRGINRILFYGAGEVAELAYLYLQFTNVRLAGILDEEGEGAEFFGLKMEGISRLKQKDWDAILITRLEDTRRIFAVLRDAGVDQERIVTL
ncbi:MAG: winged helix-turn-helix transcriptional regulator [Deltaproteobacteria bacterium]|nr:winged helix-turn-helix transcriptional regulator [Deltaproteobacteria bacterium]MBW1930565.1 winged helix-turn-helix transcriptional regulator [Deltaproteobacteria bacterium]MBW2026019.1 winged helix-turn-helix transcriptional regulator [Deltaproteobacteria bacterium]MBW2126527.1 winged helix-turn-helix transcriptional regulator [Deltaproteobacteria bacterium]